MEFFANFDEVKKLFSSGHSAAAIRRKLSAVGKITMTERTLQKYLKKHLGLRGSNVTPYNSPPMPQKPPLPPVVSGGVKVDEKPFAMVKSGRHYEKEKEE